PATYEVLLLETRPEDIRLVVSRLDAQLRERGADPTIGVAVYPRDGRSPDALLTRASGEPPSRSPVQEEAAPAPGAMQDLYRMVTRKAAPSSSTRWATCRSPPKSSCSA